MKKLIPLIVLVTLSGCSSFKEQHTSANPEIRYREQRVEIVAQNLVKDGKAKNTEDAKPLAETIVDREIADQKAAGRENEHDANFFKESDKRAE
jgi:hypothetical protein